MSKHYVLLAKVKGALQLLSLRTNAQRKSVKATGYRLLCARYRPDQIEILCVLDDDAFNAAAI